MSGTNGHLQPYSESLPYTYAFGRFAVTEALKHRPQDVTQVLWHRQIPDPHLDELKAAADAAAVPASQDDAWVARLRRNAKVDCLATVTKRPELLLPDAGHVVLVNPSHPGNVGTAIRSMVAFGLNDLALIAPRLDHWGAYVVRASVGLRFAIRCQVFSALPEYLHSVATRHIYSFSADAQADLDSTRFQRPLSLLFGPEWRSPDSGQVSDITFRDHSMVSIKIPQSQQVESLNLATSVSIAAYAARK